jgi:hypothetical protein
MWDTKLRIIVQQPLLHDSANSTRSDPITISIIYSIPIDQLLRVENV